MPNTWSSGKPIDVARSIFPDETWVYNSGRKIWSCPSLGIEFRKRRGTWVVQGRERKRRRASFKKSVLGCGPYLNTLLIQINTSLEHAHASHAWEGEICVRCWTDQKHADAQLLCKERSGYCLNCTYALKPEDYDLAECPYCGVK